MPQALLIVDFQNDFIPPDGALAVPGGDEIADRINELAASGEYDLVVATRDWHPPDHGSFEENGGPWPRHCVQGTPGAELAPDLDTDRVDAVIDIGQDPHTDGYSAFERPELTDLLRERGVEALTIVGLATNICVRATAMDAIREGLLVTVDTRGSRGIDVEGVISTDRSLFELEEAGARIIH